MEEYYEALNFRVAAIQLTPDNANYITDWCNGRQVQEIGPAGETYPGVNVPTPTGPRRLSQGDYIIKAEGAFAVVNKNLFESRYKRV